MQLQVALLSFHANLAGPKLVEKNPNGKKYLELIIFLKFEHSSNLRKMIKSIRQKIKKHTLFDLCQKKSMNCAWTCLKS